MLASEIISELGEQLNDVSQNTWSESALIKYINSAQEMIASIRPDASSLISTMKMVSGSRQAVPSTSRRLLTISGNMGSDGLTPGRAIYSADRDSLDLFNFNWHAATKVAEVKNFVYDEKTPDTFYVDPPSDGTGYIEISTSVIPAKISVVTDTLSLGDIYRNHIIQWCMFRAYSVEVDSASSQSRARKHEVTFYEIMGKKYQRDIVYSPSEEAQQGVR